MPWNFIRPFAKRRPATDRPSVSPVEEARPAAADLVPKRRRAAPLLDVPPAAQARALVSLLQEQDHGTENQIRTPEMRRIHAELCDGLGWRPCKWNPLAHELARITTGGKKVYARLPNADGTTTKQRIYPIPPRSEVALVDGSSACARLRRVS
jgi:hypothetical protein